MAYMANHNEAAYTDSMWKAADALRGKSMLLNTNMSSLAFCFLSTSPTPLRLVEERAPRSSSNSPFVFASKARNSV